MPEQDPLESAIQRILERLTDSWLPLDEQGAAADEAVELLVKSGSPRGQTLLFVANGGGSG